MGLTTPGTHPDYAQGAVLLVLATPLQWQLQVYASPRMHPVELSPPEKICFPTSYNWGKRALGPFRRGVPGPQQDLVTRNKPDLQSLGSPFPDGTAAAVKLPAGARELVIALIVGWRRVSGRVRGRVRGTPLSLT